MVFMRNLVAEALPKLYFLILGYGVMYNEQIWQMFFSSSEANHFSVHVHLTTNISAPFKGFKYVQVKTVKSKYCSLIMPPMIELLRSALSESVHSSDKFIFLSSDTIPVKSFRNIYDFYRATNHSSLCITPTAQWNTANNLAAVKQHQWVVLTKHDARKVVETWSTVQDNVIDLFSPLTMKNMKGVCWEEYYFHTALHGLFNVTSKTTLNSEQSRVYPSDVEQGECNTYVHWPDYHSKSVFVANNVPRLPDDVNQLLINPPVQLFHHLKRSPNFFFVRKIRSDNNETVLLRSKHGIKETLTVKAYFEETKFYD